MYNIILMSYIDIDFIVIGDILQLRNCCILVSGITELVTIYLKWFPLKKKVLY